MSKRIPIGRVLATVEFDVYEGDNLDACTFNWFEYAEPGIKVTKDGGHLAVCTRPCRIIGQAELHLNEPGEKQ